MKYCTEWLCLECLCTPLGMSVAAQARDLMLHRDFSWGRLIELAALHKVLPHVAHVLTHEPSLAEIPPDRMLSTFERLLGANHHKLVVYADALRPLLRALEEREIPYALTKGFSFQGTLYPVGARHVGDADLMIAPEHRDDVCHVLQTHGFVQGRARWSSCEIEPHSRRQMIHYTMNPDHLPLHLKLTGDKIAPHVRVDFANSFTWSGSEWSVNVPRALLSVETMQIAGPELEFNRLSQPYNFLFTALHLYREASFESSRFNVDLHKFLDCVLLFRQLSGAGQWGEVGELMALERVLMPVQWVLTHMDEVFGTDSVSCLSLPVLPLAFVQGAYGTNGSRRQWQGTMRQRLYLDRNDLTGFRQLEVPHGNKRAASH